MNSVQNDVATFIDANGLRCDPATRALDLASEFGEVAKEILMAGDYGKRPVTVTDDLREELGDLGFSLYALAAELDVDLESRIAAALTKYQQRIADTGQSGSGKT